MGLGVEPNTNWPSNNDYKALQLGTGACVFGRGSGDEDRGGIAVNWYSDGSNNKYLGNGNAARIYLADGNIYFSTAASNSSGANAAMTLNDKMIITSGGQLLLGTTSGGLATGDELVISTSEHTGMTIRSGNAHEGNIFFGDPDYGAAGIIRYEHNNNAMVFKTNSTGQERLRIDSSGNVKVVARGSSTSGAPFYVAVTGKSDISYAGGNDDTACLRIVDNGSNNSYYHGLELRARQGGDVRLYCQDRGNDVSDLVIATDNSGITER